MASEEQFALVPHGSRSNSMVWQIVKFFQALSQPPCMPIVNKEPKEQEVTDVEDADAEALFQYLAQLRPAGREGRQIKQILKSDAWRQRDNRLVDRSPSKKLELQDFWQVFAGKFERWPHETRELVKRQGSSWRGKSLLLLKWALPMFLCGSSMFLCSFMLHYATYRYVHLMHDMQKNYNATEDATFQPWPYSIGKTPEDESFGSNDDVVELWLGYRWIETGVLDMLAAFFPGCFMLTVVLLHDIRTFTKVMMCNSILALLKGVLAVVTLVPDSRGWAGCASGLKSNGVTFFKEDHSALELFIAEIRGVQGKHLRWCADMMFSAHTYLACLYGLGFYELLRIWFAPVKHGYGRWMPLTIVFIFGVVYQCEEIFCILKTRFHYTSDVIIAVILTFLFYTNGVINKVAMRWAVLGVPGDPECITSQGAMKNFRYGGDMLVPICCFPFCCFAGRLHMFSDDDIDHLCKGIESGDLERSTVKEALRMGEGVNFSNFLPDLHDTVDASDNKRPLLGHSGVAGVGVPVGTYNPGITDSQWST